MNTTETPRVIFDMDGLLLDTEQIYTRCYQLMLDKFSAGDVYTLENKLQLMGREPLDAAKRVLEMYKIKGVDAQMWREELRGLLEDHMKDCKWMKGICKLIHHLYKNKIEMAVATSSDSHSFALKTEKLHSKAFGTFFSTIVTSSDVSQGKPDPELFLKAASKLTSKTDVNVNSMTEFIVFEDSPLGVEAAQAAQMKCVMIPDWGVNVEKESKLVDCILNSALDLKNDNCLQMKRLALPTFEYSRGVKYVIFDLDGIILDSMHVYRDLFETCVTKFKMGLSDVFAESHIGARQSDYLQVVAEKLKLSDQELQKIQAFTVEYLKDKWHHLELMPGVKRLIHHLEEQKVPMAIATSSNENSVRMKLFESEVHSWIVDTIPVIVNGSDPEVKRGKPAPDTFIVAAQRLGVTRANLSQCLVFEDSDLGCKGARECGMQVVMVPEAKNFHVEYTKDATQVLSSIEEFDPSEFGLPPFVNS